MFSKADYEKYFSPTDYVKEWAGKDMPFYPEKLQELFLTGTVKGETYLEYGAGPTLHSVAAVSPYVNEITIAEMLPQNRRELVKWLNDDNGAINWDNYIEHLIKLGDVTDTTDIRSAIEKRKTLMRKSVKEVIHCDALLPNPLAPVEAMFDVVGTSLMLDCAFGSTYAQRLKNASTLVKPGGYFIQFLNGAGSSDWKCGPVFFKVVDPQTPENNAIALEEAGFEVLETATFSLPASYCDDGLFDCLDMFLMVCRKRLNKNQ